MIGFIILSFIIISIIFVLAKIFYGYYYIYTHREPPYLIDNMEIFVNLLMLSIMLLIGVYIFKDGFYFDKKRSIFTFLFFWFYIFITKTLDEKLFGDNKQLNKRFIKFFFSILFYPFTKFMQILFYPFKKIREKKKEKEMEEELKRIKIEEERRRKEKEKRIMEIRNKLIERIDRLLEISCNFYEFLSQKGLVDKYIVVDTNMFLTQRGMSIVERLINYNFIVVFSGVLDELEKLREQKKTTDISINYVVNFIKNNIKSNRAKMEYLNFEEKLYYDRKGDIYADKYFAELLNKNPEYFFITWDNSLFIRLYGKFKDRILDPKEFEELIENEELINMLRILRFKVKSASEYDELDRIEKKLNLLSLKIITC